MTRWQIRRKKKEKFENQKIIIPKQGVMKEEEEEREGVIGRRSKDCEEKSEVAGKEWEGKEYDTKASTIIISLPLPLPLPLFLPFLLLHYIISIVLSSATLNLHTPTHLYYSYTLPSPPTQRHSYQLYLHF